LGGGRATPARPGRCKRQAFWGGRGHFVMTARQRLTDALAASAQPIPHTLWLPSKAWALDGLQARKPVPCAARRRGARHNGSLVNPPGRVTQCSGGSTKRSVSVVTDDILPNSPLCSVGTAHLPLRCCQGAVGFGPTSSCKYVVLRDQRLSSCLAFNSYSTT
jgi:hypothetical protein